MAEMEEFFNFLNQHIKNGGYNQMLKKYQLTPLEKELYLLDENGLFAREPEFYYKPDLLATLIENSEEMLTTDEELLDLVFLNPEKQYILTKTYDNTGKNLIKEETIFFYNDLQYLYKNKIEEFKNSYGRFLMECETASQRIQFETGLFMRLDYFIGLTSKDFYMVFPPKDIPINLILQFLQNILDWLTQQQPNNAIQLEPKAEPIIDGTVTNAFNSMPIEKVREHFKKLTTDKSKNGKSHLTQEQFEQFITKVFLKGENPLVQKIEMNFLDGELQTIRELFYKFYLESKSDYKYEGTHHSKEKYVRLLTDNFEKFEYKKIFDNFNK